MAFTVLMWKLMSSVQHVYYVDQMAEVLADLGPPALHLLSGINTDSDRKTQEVSSEICCILCYSF